jgi:hypothetical protein
MPKLKWIRVAAGGGFAHPRKPKRRDGGEQLGKAALMSPKIALESYALQGGGEVEPCNLETVIPWPTDFLSEMKYY